METRFNRAISRLLGALHRLRYDLTHPIRQSVPAFQMAELLLGLAEAAHHLKGYAQFFAYLLKQLIFSREFIGLLVVGRHRQSLVHLFPHAGDGIRANAGLVGMVVLLARPDFLNDRKLVAFD
jgi:hypothetical protein